MEMLDKIIRNKKKEVAERKSLVTTKLLERSVYFETRPVSLKKYLLRPEKSGIIAEIKRKSPSRGVLNPQVSIEQISIGYMQAGASAISVLTDSCFFGGQNEDLTIARKFNFCPVLRKDFIIDEYQVLESKSIGADAILLIAACLSYQALKSLSELSSSLGMEVLLEIHSEKELEIIGELNIELIGVNNRDLQSMVVDIATSARIGPCIPDQFIKVSESGIKTAADIQYLSDFGFHAFLIGEVFMSQPRPEEACRSFIEDILKTKSKVISHG